MARKITAECYLAAKKIVVILIKQTDKVVIKNLPKLPVYNETIIFSSVLRKIIHFYILLNNKVNIYCKSHVSNENST